MIAASYGHESVVKLLLTEYQANVHETNKYHLPRELFWQLRSILIILLCVGSCALLQGRLDRVV